MIRSGGSVARRPHRRTGIIDRAISAKIRIEQFFKDVCNANR
jgi:hypothetical protein